ncbi:hypothetical protein KXD93_21315 [Mucilaginibacter sp. BJC16-A38]|uniref:hypothetical protein n=1 Tax=Mucilaginibacter phenanthrenivorans TaxID=1234842 RepID=UPI00215857F4|nr:hypothetical protein [Mucilaginibacter phenanthrenivorans]MCR8560205.1 hypothetical protein [Mucilaginibacter phenanthrenivorans]
MSRFPKIHQSRVERGAATGRTPYPDPTHVPDKMFIISGNVDSFIRRIRAGEMVSDKGVIKAINDSIQQKKGIFGKKDAVKQRNFAIRRKKNMIFKVTILCKFEVLTS